VFQALTQLQCLLPPAIQGAPADSKKPGNKVTPFAACWSACKHSLLVSLQAALDPTSKPSHPQGRKPHTYNISVEEVELMRVSGRYQRRAYEAKKAAKSATTATQRKAFLAVAEAAKAKQRAISKKLAAMDRETPTTTPGTQVSNQKTPHFPTTLPPCT
jgi:hypothetical protein